MCYTGGGSGGVMLFFSTMPSIVPVKLVVQPPTSRKILAVFDQMVGHCWVLVYRPKDNISSNDTHCLYEALKAIQTELKIVTILGNFNVHGIKWRRDFSSNRHYMAANQLSYEFLKICAQFDLTQLVSFPTRGENYLDLILTTNPEKFSEVTDTCLYLQETTIWCPVLS